MPQQRNPPTRVAQAQDTTGAIGEGFFSFWKEARQRTATRNAHGLTLALAATVRHVSTSSY